MLLTIFRTERALLIAYFLYKNFQNAKKDFFHKKSKRISYDEIYRSENDSELYQYVLDLIKACLRFFLIKSEEIKK